MECKNKRGLKNIKMKCSLLKQLVAIFFHCALEVHVQLCMKL